METSQNDNEEQQTLRSPPRRRRSTFFVRRDSLAQPQSENIYPNVSTQETDNKTKQDENLERYYSQLMSEKEQWKKEVNNRRYKYHDLRQQYQIFAKAPSRTRISFAALANEDIEFLKGKQNLAKLVEHQTNLHKSVELTRAMYKRHMELENVLISQVEKKLNKVTEYILENSTVDTLE